MGFSDAQTRALQRNVGSRNIRTRVSNGKELSYIEGWYAIVVANRIFGFDGWDRETLEAKCVLAREARGAFLVVYTARVRVTVRTDDRVVVRDGYGTCEGRGNLPGEAHELGLKGAETDATKRALATFGKSFGLALYARGRRRALNGSGTPPEPARQNGAGRTGSGNENTDFDVPVAAGEAPRLPSDHPPDNGLERDNLTTIPVRLGGMQLTVAARSIDKSALPLGEPRRVRDKEHLRYVASQPCLLCSARPSDPHHVRFAQPRALGRKVGDEFTVPLCRKHHRDLHHSGDEAAWWHDMGIDAVEIARQLWSETIARR